MKHRFLDTIRKKTTFFLVVFAVCLLLAIFILAQTVLLNSFMKLENQQTLNELEAALIGLQNEIDRIDSIAGDWAPWDATHQYMRDFNPGYIRQNLSDASVANLNIDLFVLVNTAGKIVYSKGYDVVADHSVEIVPGFQQYLAEHPELVTHTSAQDTHAGLVEINRTELVLASHPIVNSAFGGDIRGSLIIGRYLDQARLSTLNQHGGLEIELQNIHTLTPGSDFADIYTSRLQDNQAVVQPVGRKTVSGYALYDDIYGEPSFIFRISSPREIFLTGTRSLTFFMAAIVIISLLFGAIFLNSLDRSILRRIHSIASTVNLVRSTSDLSLRIRTWGHDELSLLARQLNEMFETLYASSQKLAENQSKLEHEARHDALTGFPNRAFFVNRLQQALENRRKDCGERCAVLFLDLDRFKLVNDSFNHEFGDMLLVELSRRLARCVRADDFVSRFGGDEFVILLEHVTQEETAIEVAERIKRELDLPFFIRGKTIFVTASVGITFVESDERPENALRNADIAMYRAKALGKARYAIFDRSLLANSYTRLELENELRRGLAQGEFEVYYQPIVSIINGQTVSVEALVRWHHPTRGLLSPAEFLSTAEETGLILPLSEFVTATALSHLRQLNDKGFDSLRMSINYSYMTLREPHFVEWLTNQIETLHLNPQNVQIELTENAVMTDFVPTMSTLHRLKAAGIQLALDDFGTGYSSLIQIKNIPTDCLKIDRAFISNMLEPGGDQAVVLAVIEMAHQLGVALVAEGIETREQMDFLLEHGCEYGQGYYFSKAMAFSALLKYLRQPVSIV